MSISEAELKKLMKFRGITATENNAMYKPRAIGYSVFTTATIPDKITISIIPIGKPRMTRADTWKKRPAVVRYYDYADKLRSLLSNYTTALIYPDNTLTVDFYLPLTPGWTKKKKEQYRGNRHHLKPDIDNIEKGFMDITLPAGDSQVWAKCTRKFWADEGAIVIHLKKSAHFQ